MLFAAVEIIRSELTAFGVTAELGNIGEIVSNTGTNHGANSDIVVSLINIEEDRVSAMSAAMLSLGERIASELGRGQLDQVYIRGDSGYVILMSVGEEAVLTTLVRENAKLGLIFLDMKCRAEFCLTNCL